MALHSFTPVYLDERRPWHVGALYGRDARLGRLVLEGLRRDRALVVGDNHPYAVSDPTGSQKASLPAFSHGLVDITFEVGRGRVQRDVRRIIQPEYERCAEG